MNTEEPSDWDSMSDPATEDQPSSFEISRQQDGNRTKQEITASSRVQEINDSPVRDLQRPKSAYKRTIDSEDIIARTKNLKKSIVVYCLDYFLLFHRLYKRYTLFKYDFYNSLTK